jgi:hypothetical protein
MISARFSASFCPGRFQTGHDNDVFGIDTCLLSNVHWDCSVGLNISYDCI